MDSLLVKTQACEKNPEKLFTATVKKPTAYCYSRFLQCSFNATKSKHDQKLDEKML